jgi:hypothetical protein
MTLGVIIRHFKLSPLFVAMMVALMLGVSLLAIFVAWKIPTWENLRAVFDLETARMFFGVWLFMTLFTLPMSIKDEPPPSPTVKETE